MVQKDEKLKIVLALLQGLLWGLAATVLVAMIAAGLLSAEKIAEGNMGMVSTLAILLGSATTALITVSKAKQMRFVMCLVAGVVYLLGISGCAAILFDGIKGGLGATTVVILGGVLSVYLLGMKQGKQQKYRVPKVRI